MRAAILSLLPLLRPAVGGVMIRRAMVPLALMLILAIVAGMLATIVLVIALMLLHHVLREAGVTPSGALAISALTSVALLAIVIFAMYRVAFRARSAMKPKGLSDLTDAFLSGFNK